MLFRKKNLLRSRVEKMPIPYAGEISEGWTPVRLFFGQTKSMDALWCHLSVLKNGYWPHPPHKHLQEECVLMLSGEAELIIPDAPDGVENRKVGPGDLSYYPLNFAHTIKTTSEEPAHYFMLKWHSDLTHSGADLSFSEAPVFNQQVNDTEEVSLGQTDFLKSLRCFTSVLKPGYSSLEKSNDFDTITVVLSGEIETLGQKAEAYDVIYYAAGEPHGMRSMGTSEAKLITFEFHAWPQTWVGQIFRPFLVFGERIKDPERWKRKIRTVYQKDG